MSRECINFCSVVKYIVYLGIFVIVVVKCFVFVIICYFFVCLYFKDDKFYLFIWMRDIEVIFYVGLWVDLLFIVVYLFMVFL